MKDISLQIILLDFSYYLLNYIFEVLLEFVKFNRFLFFIQDKLIVLLFCVQELYVGKSV